jgi:hypothetical protein
VKRSTIAIILLSLALVLSNGWWFLQVLDSGVTATYRQASLEEHHEALAQAFSVFPVAARPNATRAEVLTAAAQAATHKDSFEKDGFVWVGRLGFRFDQNGRLAEVAPAWDPF